MFEWIGRLWCKKAHTRRMWPIHGRYICAQCLRQHPVAWDNPRFAAKTGVAPETFPDTSDLAGAQRRRLTLIVQPGLRRENCVTFPGGS